MWHTKSYLQLIITLTSEVNSDLRFWGWKSEEKGSGFHVIKSPNLRIMVWAYFMSLVKIFAVKILNLRLGPLPFKIRWTHNKILDQLRKLQNQTWWKWTVYFTNGPRIKVKQFFYLKKNVAFFKEFDGCKVEISKTMFEL